MMWTILSSVQAMASSLLVCDYDAHAVQPTPELAAAAIRVDTATGLAT